MVWASPSSEILLIKDTSYLTLTCELWGFYCEAFSENWHRTIFLQHNITYLFIFLWFMAYIARQPCINCDSTHYNDVIMSAVASQITSLTIVHSSVWFGRRSKKTSKLRVTGLCVENSPVTGEFPAQMASNRRKCFHLTTSSCPLKTPLPCCKPSTSCELL